MARAQRPKLRDAPLPVIVPLPRGPEYIPAEYRGNALHWVQPGQAMRETYEVIHEATGRPWLRRKDD